MRQFLARFSVRVERAALRNACLAATLATSWNGTALAGFEFDVAGYVEPQAELQSAFLYVTFFQGNGSGASIDSFLYALGPVVPPGVRTDYRFTIDTGYPGGFPYPPDQGWQPRYAVIGLDAGSAGLVTIGHEPSVAIGLFSGSGEWPYYPEQPDIASFLAIGFDDGIRSFFTSNTIYSRNDVLSPLGVVSTLVQFAPAAPNGTSFFDIACSGAPGDANCDGTVDFFDIDPFLLALFDQPTYLASGCSGGACCAGSICAVDVDGSGVVDFFDIDPFLTCLFAGCP